MILFTSKITCSEGCELPFILEHLIQWSSDDHVEINIELFALDSVVFEECHFTPPFFPTFFQRLDLDLRQQICWIFSEAVEIEFPSGVPLDTRIKFVDIRCWVSITPLHTKNTDLFFPKIRFFLPFFYLEPRKGSVIGSLFLGEVDNFLPCSFNSLLFPTELSQDICEIDNWLRMSRI